MDTSGRVGLGELRAGGSNVGGMDKEVLVHLLPVSRSMRKSGTRSMRSLQRLGIDHLMTYCTRKRDLMYTQKSPTESCKEPCYKSPHAHHQQFLRNEHALGADLASSSEP